jgi:hypothetical protein
VDPLGNGGTGTDVVLVPTPNFASPAAELVAHLTEQDGTSAHEVLRLLRDTDSATLVTGLWALGDAARAAVRALREHAAGTGDPRDPLPVLAADLLALHDHAA